MRIEIDIPRPGTILLLIAAAIAGAVWASGGMGPVGGRVSAEHTVIREAEAQIRDLRLEQEVLSRRETILRAELDVLQAEIDRTFDARLAEELMDTRARLLMLIGDQKEAERQILTSLRQIWEAQAFTQDIRGGYDGIDPLPLLWPVEPLLGISATFGDERYERRFGIPHRAIDIPVAQGSMVAAAADGIVVRVSDNGLGFNSLVIRHGGGYATLYGHVSRFLVQEGQEVRAGDPVALSGGMPGTPGAGLLTTGPHLHFEVIKDGRQVDPMALLAVHRVLR
jgi:murein DD-endopeptidase MepM/ murein hydrolase activator NlpD